MEKNTFLKTYYPEIIYLILLLIITMMKINSFTNYETRSMLTGIAFLSWMILASVHAYHNKKKSSIYLYIALATITLLLIFL